MQISDQGSKQKTFAFLPKWIAAAAFSLRVGHQGRDQPQNILFAVDIGEGIVVHTLGKVNGIQDFQLVTVFQKCVPALRVSDHIGTVTL